MSQGMYAMVALPGSATSTKRIVVTTEAITLSLYDNVPLLNVSERGLDNGWLAYVHRRMKDNPISKDRFLQDFGDLANAVGNVDRTTFMLPCGSKVVTYCKGEPVKGKDEFLEMSWERKEWWTQNPFIEPIMTSIKDYYPDFAPWKGNKEPIIAALLARSSLI